MGKFVCAHMNTYTYEHIHTGTQIYSQTHTHTHTHWNWVQESLGSILTGSWKCNVSRMTDLCVWRAGAISQKEVTVMGR